MLLIKSLENLNDKKSDLESKINNLCNINKYSDDAELLEVELGKVEDKIKIIKREISLAYGRNFLKESGIC